jgi:hypothetical protein
MNSVIDPDLAVRLAKICGMFGSSHDGERASAAAKADSLVRSLGLTWHDVVVRPSPPSSRRSPSHSIHWQRMAAFCQARNALLNSREQEFIRSMLAWRGEPTERQWNWLCDLYARLYSEAA